MKRIVVFAFVSLIAGCLYTLAQDQISYKSWRTVVQNKDLQWFASDEAKSIAENVLLYQRDIGGWPKNIAMQEPLTNDEKAVLRQQKKESDGCTTDNGATVQEMIYLLKVYSQIHDVRYKNAVLKGIDYLLEAQYANGGWPQFYPRSKGYYTHITYNDNSMANIMRLLKDLVDGKNIYAIGLKKKTRLHAQKAFDKGIDCIVKTQYKQNGVPTGWCAQHDENTLLPAKARAYELPSLSGQESAGIVLVLMSVDHPSADVKNAINSAVAWFEKTKLTGFRIESYTTEDGQKEKRMVQDTDAEPLWARFMELADNTPFFCDRDGIKKASIFEIGQERRVGYAWYSNQPNDVLRKYPKWKEKWGE
ncbi:MAG: pectate lyase [Breznakibacter sp.]